MSYRSKAFALAFVLAGLARSAEPVRLPDLTAEALANNREIRAAEERYKAARQKPSPARSLPDPVLSAGYTSNGGPLPGQGLGTNATSNIGVMITQELPSAAKRRLRSEIAAKDADAEFEAWQATELNVRSRVAQAFHRLHHAWASLQILGAGKDNITTLLRVSEARYTAGLTSQQDIFRAQAQLSALEARIIRMQQDQQSAVAEINSLLNRAPGSALGDPGDDEPAPLPMTVDELLAKAAQATPELRRAIDMIQRSELGVNLARRELHPDYSVSAGYFNQGTMPAMYQVRVDIPLRLHTSSRERPAISESVDLLAESRRNFEAAEQNLQFRVRDAWSAAETAWRLRALYADTILPQTQLTVDSALAAYSAGTNDLLSVLNNVATKIDIEEQMHEESLNYSIAVARLEEMTGVRLTSDIQGKESR